MNINLNLSCFSSSLGDSEGQTLGGREGQGSCPRSSRDRLSNQTATYDSEDKEGPLCRHPVLQRLPA